MGISAWQAFLATNLPAWDGTAESRDQFKEWFAYHAAEQGFGNVPTANDQLPR